MLAGRSTVQPHQTCTHLLPGTAGLSDTSAGALHIILTEDHEIALDLSPAAQAYLSQATAMFAGRRTAEQHEELHLRSGNRRAITAAVTAQIMSMEGVLAQTSVGMFGP